MKLLRFLFTARLSFLLCAFLAFAFTFLCLSASQHRRALVQTFRQCETCCVTMVT